MSKPRKQPNSAEPKTSIGRSFPKSTAAAAEAETKADQTAAAAEIKADQPAAKAETKQSSFSADPETKPDPIQERIGKLIPPFAARAARK